MSFFEQSRQYDDLVDQIVSGELTGLELDRELARIVNDGGRHRLSVVLQLPIAPIYHHLFLAGRLDDVLCFAKHHFDVSIPNATTSETLDHLFVRRHPNILPADPDRYFHFFKTLRQLAPYPATRRDKDGLTALDDFYLLHPSMRPYAKEILLILAQNKAPFDEEDWGSGRTPFQAFESLHQWKAEDRPEEILDLLRDAPQSILAWGSQADIQAQLGNDAVLADKKLAKPKKI